MNRSGTLRFVAVFLATFVLSFAVLSKVPFRQCHCHERSNQLPPGVSKEECPFGKLRMLTVVLADPPVLKPVTVLQSAQSPTFTLESHPISSSASTIQARGPPSSIAL